MNIKQCNTRQLPIWAGHCQLGGLNDQNIHMVLMLHACINGRTDGKLGSIFHCFNTSLDIKGVHTSYFESQT